MSTADLSQSIGRNPLRIVCAVLAIFSGIGVYFVNTKIEEAHLTLPQKSAEGERLAANVREGGQLQEQLDTLTAAGVKIQNRMIRASQLANNLQYFYRLENEAGVELIDVRQTTPALKAAGPVGFTVSVKGDYPTLIGFLRRLENGPHFCRINSSFIAAPTPDRAGLLTITVNLDLLGQP
jgi:hypothetical protein